MLLDGRLHQTNLALVWLTYDVFAYSRTRWAKKRGGLYEHKCAFFALYENAGMVLE